MRKKYADVRNIVKREFPIIQHVYPNVGRWEVEEITLHIVDQVGDVDSHGITGKSEVRSQDVTHCKRVPEHWDFADWGKINSAKKEESGVHFCKRCGTPEDFVAVMEAWDKRQLHQKEEGKKRDEERKAAYAEMCRKKEAALRKFGLDLWNTGLFQNIKTLDNSLEITIPAENDLEIVITIRSIK